MCAATAAAVGTAVATVAAVGSQVASGAIGGGSSGGGGGSAGGPPKQQKVPGFAPATGLQSYTARLLAANRNTRTPGLLDWAASGGTLRPDWKVPDLTPREAEQLRFVEKGTGKVMPTYAPESGKGLSPEAQAQLGREKAKNLKAEGYKVTGDNPQVRYGQLSAREEMLQTRIAEKGQLPGLTRKLANVQTRKERVGKRLGL